ACCRRIRHLLTREDVRSCREAIEVQERFADGQAAEAELSRAHNRVNADTADAAALAHPGGAASYAVCCADLALSYAVEAVTASEAVVAAQAAARSLAYAAVARHGDITVAVSAASRGHQPRQGRIGWDAAHAHERAVQAWDAAYARGRAGQAELLRCVFGNPYRPLPSIDPVVLRWHDGLIPRLARAVYDERLLPSGTLDNTRLAVLADALEEAGVYDERLLAHCRSPGPHVRGCVAVDAILGKS